MFRSTHLRPAPLAEPAAARPTFVYHPSFEGPEAVSRYGAAPEEIPEATSLRYLPDELTQDHARRMHYAAYRCSRAPAGDGEVLWRRRYLAWRDRIVLGNLKLVYRAVRRWRTAAWLVEDLAAECRLVLIQTVAGFNPWAGVRFSTYAFTCLMRCVARQTRRQTALGPGRAVSLDDPGSDRCALADWKAGRAVPEWLGDYFEDSNPVLSQREKLVLRRRFGAGSQADGKTLDQIGCELGVSRERVRQLQVSGLQKLRKELTGRVLVG